MIFYKIPQIAYESELLATTKIFRTAYFNAKSNKQFSEQFDLLEIQEFNGADVPNGLRSRNSATNIIDQVARETKAKICEKIIQENGKISVLIDESTNLV